MSQRLREGLALLAVAAICLILGLVMTSGNDEGTSAHQVGVVAQGGAMLFGIGGLALIVFGLLRSR